MRSIGSVFGLFAVGIMMLSACAGPQTAVMVKSTPTAEAMKKEMPTAGAIATQPADDKGMSKATATPDGMMKKETPMSDAAMSKSTLTAEAMMKKETPTTEAAMPKPTAAAMADKGTAMPEKPTAMAETPAWLKAQLTDVSTGKPYALADLKGKVVLVENMAIWCSTCLRQQKEVEALQKTLGDRSDLARVTLGVDPNETPEALKAYVAKNGFGGLYSVAPSAVAREISQQLGNQFINPPSAPMFVIDRQGKVHPLPFGVKSAQALADALKPYLEEKM